MDIWAVAITAVATLIGGLGGSLGGVALANKNNAQNQKERLEAERVQWERQEKLAAYARFWNAQWDFFHAIMGLERGAERDATLLTLSAAARPTDVLMLAPKDIEELATSIHRRLMWLGGTVYPGSQPYPHVTKSMDTYKADLDRFEKLIREDVQG